MQRRYCRSMVAGASYVECLVAIALIAACLAPALDALRDGVAAAGTQRGTAVEIERLRARVEEVLSNDYRVLDAAALAAGNDPAATVPAYSDPPGTPGALRVALYRYDGAGSTAAETGMLWIGVVIEGSARRIDTLKSRW